MKQPRDLAGIRIDSRQIRPLEAIAAMTSQSQVGIIVITVVLSGDDVFHMKSDGKVVLSDAAILASSVSPFTYLALRFCVHHLPADARERAFA